MSAHLVEPDVDLPRPLKAAELSSQQRNALVDSLVAVANNHAKVLAEMRTRVDTLEGFAKRESLTALELRRDFDAQVQSEAVQHLEHRARLDAHANILLRLRLRDRLRWLVLGR